MVNINTNISASQSVVERVSKYLDTAFPIFFFLMAESFYLRTYDSAMVKITELQMFGIILMALWLCKIFESGHWPFKKNQTLIILPFLVIFTYGVLSFIGSPLHWGSYDFFIRRVVYIGIAMIAATEMTSLNDFRRITKWLILSVAVCTIYGLIQWVDYNFFPPGPPTVGLDKFVWRRAFASRVFSTFGNPNFYSNFLVIMFPVMMAMYLKSRKFYLIPLMALTLVNIYWTGSKGPVAGLMAGTAVFSFLIMRFFVRNAQLRFRVFSIAAIIILLFGGFIIKKVFFGGHVTSFTFRMYTWLSTWEMVNAKPVTGNGIGTFWVIYPAYRRPAIFHIESKHNSETDHAENEHLEVWMDEGIIGAGFWFWMIIMISVGMYKALAVLIDQPTRAGPSKQEQKYPEETYYILGFLSGFLGMLIHNNTDVSMRFVSSGTPFWLLAGMNAALIMYSPLPETQHSPVFADNDQKNNNSGIIHYFKTGLRILVFVTTAIIAISILRQFDWCQGRDGMSNPNELPHFAVTWGVFLLCWGSATWWIIQIAKRCSSIKSLLTLLAAVILIVPFWGIFVGDVNHNRAIFFSKQGIWTKSSEFDSRITAFPPEYQIMYGGDKIGTTLVPNSRSGQLVRLIFPDIFWRRFGIGGALEHYDEVNRLRPDFIMAHYFRGNVYNDWGSQYAQRTQEAFQRGDVAQGEIFRKKTDEFWFKSLDAYASTRKLGPNYVQMHHQVGTVHQKWGDFFQGLAPLAERYGKKDLADEYRRLANEHWQNALESYRRYYKIDPVYDQNYYRQAQIYIQTGEIDKAEQTYLDHIQAKECKKPYHQIFGGFYIKEMGHPMDRYDLASPEHTHDITLVSKPEAWVILGDFYSFVKPSAPKAEICYKKAVECRPENIDFWKRLATFYGRTGKVQDAIQSWKKIYELNPADPDVQKVIQSQPKH